MSTSRAMPSATHTPLERGPNGRYLCRWCKTECQRKKQTFCSKVCVLEWRIRTSPSELRKAVLARDNGICSMCGLDTIALKLELELLERRSGKDTWTARCEELHIPNGRRNKSLWDCAHIVAVAEGGGGTGLANVRTLCIWCHRLETNALLKKLNSNK